MVAPTAVWDHCQAVLFSLLLGHLVSQKCRKCHRQAVLLWLLHRHLHRCCRAGLISMGQQVRRQFSRIHTGRVFQSRHHLVWSWWFLRWQTSIMSPLHVTWGAGPPVAGSNRCASNALPAISAVQT